LSCIFCSADIEFDFVLMISAYSQYLKDSCKQHLFEVNPSDIWVYGDN